VTNVDYALASELVLGLKSDLLPRDAQYWEMTHHGPRVGLDEAMRRAIAAAPKPRARAWRVEEALVSRLGPRASAL
jgi:hypothetical protein